MIRNTKQFCTAAAALSAVSFVLAGAPVAAADLGGISPRQSHAAPVWSADDEVAHNHRWRRYRGGPDAGDVLAGAIIIGGIAVIADAVRDAERDAARERAEDWREERRRDENWRDDDWQAGRYPDARPEWRGDRTYGGNRDGRDTGDTYESDGLDRAIRLCADEVERREPIASVHGARRDVRGWAVEGELARGGEWRCAVGNDGRIETIDMDDRYGSDYESGYRNDERYDYSARRDTNGYSVPREDISGEELPEELERRGWVQAPRQHDARVYARARNAGAAYEPVAAPSAGGGAGDGVDGDLEPSARDGRYDLSDVGDFEG